MCKETKVDSNNLWNSVPKKARFIAQDEDGWWFWFQKKPYIPDVLEFAGQWLWQSGSDFGAIVQLDPNPQWRMTLEKRPK